MKNFIVKANNPAGNDSGATDAWGANESNSVTEELKGVITTTGQTPTAGLGADTATDQLARGITIYSQTAQSYNDSGTANAYILTSTGSYVQPTAYSAGMVVNFRPNNANTGNSTINVSAIGSRKILLNDESETPSGALTTGRNYSLRYEPTLDSGTGAFVLKFDEPRAATETEVDNQTDVDAYVKPGQLGTGAIATVGTADSEIPTGENVTTRVQTVSQVTLDYSVTGAGGQQSVTGPTDSGGDFVFTNFYYLSGTVTFLNSSSNGRSVTVTGVTGATYRVTWTRNG